MLENLNRCAEGLLNLFLPPSQPNGDELRRGQAFASVVARRASRANIPQYAPCVSQMAQMTFISQMAQMTFIAGFELRNISRILSTD